MGFNKNNDNNNNAINNNNLYNMNYDIKAAPFLPKNNNYQVNPNINNLNVNNVNNNNNYLFAKGRQNWICPFCNNYNLRSKYEYLFNYKYSSTIM